MVPASESRCGASDFYRVDTGRPALGRCSALTDLRTQGVRSTKSRVKELGDAGLYGGSVYSSLWKWVDLGAEARFASRTIRLVASTTLR